MKQQSFPTVPFEDTGKIYVLRLGTTELFEFNDVTNLLEHRWSFGMPLRFEELFYAHYNQNLELWSEPCYRLLDESFEPVPQALFAVEWERFYQKRRQKRAARYSFVPGTKPRGGSYYRHPRTLNEMKERERLSEELDGAGYAHLDRSRRKKLPSTWDDLYAYRLRNWKKQRHTQWKVKG